uniref:hypothetical protein n=1 Tax=uncultured Draconibacterium sp. TaxID=1573823 RepID=UPI003216A39B
MSLGKKYTFGFYDRQNRHFEAEIYREGYAGAAEAVAELGLPAVVIDKGTPSDYVLEPIKGSAATVRLMKTQMLQYLDFFSSDFKNSRLDIKVDGTLFWRGWCLPDIYSEPMLRKTVTLQFTDGLSLLSDLDFELTGNQSLFDIIKYCLGLLSLNIPLECGASIREDSISTATSVEPLDQIDYNASEFNGRNCRDVLAELLEHEGLRIYQENATWIIEQIGDKATGETVRKYNSSFVYQSIESQNNLITPPQSTGGIVQFLAKSAAIEMIPGWKQFSLKEDYGLKSSIIDNSDFSKRTYVKTWYERIPGSEESYSSHYRYVADFENWQSTDNRVIYINWWNGVEYMSLLHVDDSITGASVSSHYVSNIIKPAVVADTQQMMRIKFDFLYLDLFGGQPKHLYFMVKCGSNYLLADGDWTTTENIIDMGEYDGNYLHATEQTFEISSANVPAGNLEVRFYYPYDSSVAWMHYWNIRGLEVTFETMQSEAYAKGSENTVVVNAANNFIGKDKEFSAVDLPVLTNSKIMYGKGLKLADNSLTNNWKYKGMQGTLSELFIYQIIENYHKLRAKITGAGFYGDGVGFKNIFSISGLSDRRFMFSNYSHDLYRSTIESAQLVEIPYMVEQNNASAYFFAQYSDKVLNLKGANATISGNYIIFPNVANDIFNKQNTTFWQSGLTIHDSDPRKWLLSEFTGTAVILYSTAACRARLFFRDYASTLDSVLPIMAFDADRTEAQQQAIVESFKEYFFITDGGFIITDDSDYLTTN